MVVLRIKRRNCRCYVAVLEWRRMGCSREGEVREAAGGDRGGVWERAESVALEMYVAGVDLLLLLLLLFVSIALSSLGF